MSDQGAGNLLAADSPVGAPFLEVRGLVKSYRLGGREINVLQGIDLEVARGEFLAIRGASGSGKTTLLHLIGGLDTPNAGEITFAGRSLTSLSELELARFRNLRVGFIFQSYHLLPELDALENVCLPARMCRAPLAATLEKARYLLERAGMGDRVQHRPAELSGGEQQRVAIARSLINDPELILADEPTGNLDSRTGSSIIDLLCAIQAERQTTLIMATHDSQVASRAPRLVHVIDGRLDHGP